MSASVWSPNAGTIVLSNLSRLSQEFTATAGQTNFPLLITPYTVGAENLEVFKNGQKLLPSVVTEVTGGASFNIAACTLGDKIEAVVFPATSASFDSLAAQAQASAAAARVSELAAAASAASISQYTGAAIGGNLTFLGSGNRIVGDFSNATISSRLMFQSSILNGATRVGLIPNGTGVTSQFTCYASSDPNNSSYGFFNAYAGDSVTFTSDKVGTGTYLPMTTYVGGFENTRQPITGGFTVSAPGGLGYGTGAGGTVTQATNKGSAVTLNKPSGQITMNAAALAANTSVAFLCNNNLVNYMDTVSLSLTTNVASAYQNYVITTAVDGGHIYFNVKNVSAGSLSEALVINFAIIKGALS